MVFGRKNNRPPSEIQQVHIDFDDGSSTELSLPPPPPPTRSEMSMYEETIRKQARDSMIQGGLFGARPAEDGLPRQAYIIEDADSIESVDMTTWPKHWNDWFDSPTNNYGRRRRACLALACLLVMCGLIGALVGTSDRGESGQRGSVAGIQGGSGTTFPPVVEEPTSMPTDRPTAQATEQATSAPGTPATDPPCEASMDSDKICYNTNEDIFVGFEMCTPHHENWVGIYNVQSLIGASSELYDPVVWLWTCGSQDLEDCNEEGTHIAELPFAVGLPPGKYQAHMVERDGWGPFQSFMSTDVFEISDSC